MSTVAPDVDGTLPPGSVSAPVTSPAGGSAFVGSVLGSDGWSFASSLSAPTPDGLPPASAFFSARALAGLCCLAGLAGAAGSDDSAPVVSEPESGAANATAGATTIASEIQTVSAPATTHSKNRCAMPHPFVPDRRHRIAYAGLMGTDFGVTAERDVYHQVTGRPTSPCDNEWNPAVSVDASAARRSVGNRGISCVKTVLSSIRARAAPMQ